MQSSSNPQEIVPVLLLGYNRPEFLIRRIQELANQNIGHITISIDGGGMTQKEIQDVINCAKQFFQREKFEFLTHDKNLGLCAHVESAISKVLSTNSNVIVLEDDICVGQNFYKNMIAGIGLAGKIEGAAAVTSFSGLGMSRLKLIRPSWRKTRYFSCWGWAVSKEVWKKYELNLNNTDINKELACSKTWKALNSHQKAVWAGRFSRVAENPGSTWDIQFQFMCFRFDLINLAPTISFSSNEGFDDPRGEHTTGRMPHWMSLVKKYDGIIPAEINSWIGNIYEKLIDEYTIAGDNQLTARTRKFKQTFF